MRDFEYVKNDASAVYGNVQIGNSSSQAPANSKRWPRSGQVLPCTTSTPAMAEWQSITFVRYSEKLEPRNTRKLHIVFNPASAVLNIRCALPAVGPRLLTFRLRRVCHSYSAGLPSQRLIKLQLRDRLCIRTRTHISHQPIEPALAVRFAVWSNSSSGIASTASGAISCCSSASTGGERAGAIAGAVVGAPATSPNSDAPLDTPHSVPATGVHPPLPPSTCNYCLRLSPAHQQRCS